MKLHDFAHSPNCRRVCMFLAEKGIEVPRQSVDLMQGEQLSDAYAAINPRCELPALETEDGVIGESVAIMAFFEAQQPEPALFGTSPSERGQVMMWEHRAEKDGFGSLEDFIRNGFEAMAGRAMTGRESVEQIPALSERGKAQLMRFFAEADAELAKHEHLAGEAFSVADITLLSVVDFAAGFAKIELPEEHANLRRWHQRVSARPSASA